MIVELTPEEILAVREMLNIALKAEGRRVIGAFAQLDPKFEKALAEKDEEKS